MKWINVNEKYLDYLRETETRIPRSNYGEDRYKPFFGILFDISDLYYITQVSHPQPCHHAMKQQKDFYKIFDSKNPERLIAIINLNYMFPIPKSETSPFEKRTYINGVDITIKVNFFKIAVICQVNVGKIAILYIYRFQILKIFNTL